MSTENENASDNQYLIWNEGKNFKKIVTYRSNVIKEIQQHSTLSENSEINSFSSENVTNEKFERFIKIVGKAGYTIYKVLKL